MFAVTWVGVDRVEEFGELLDPRRKLAVKLSDRECARAAVLDPPRRAPVSRPVDEASDGPGRSHPRRDDRLVQPVLDGHDRAMRGEVRGDAIERRLGVLRLHGEEHEVEARWQLIRGDRPHRHGPLATIRRHDPEAGGVDSLHVVGRLIDQ
jgi:hypothetical protein